MTPEQVRLVQESFAKVAPISDMAASIFYARLFQIAPEVQPLFRGDMTAQGAKLMATLEAVVNGLDDPSPVLNVARDLARRHVGYGVEPEHYEPVGKALLFALSEGLGPDFNDDVRAAWATAYGTLSAVMIEAAYGPREVAE